MLLGPGLCIQRGPSKLQNNVARYKGQVLNGNANRDQWMHPQMFPFKPVQPCLPTPTKMESVVEKYNPGNVKQKRIPGRRSRGRKFGDFYSPNPIQAPGGGGEDDDYLDDYIKQVNGEKSKKEDDESEPSTPTSSVSSPMTGSNVGNSTIVGSQNKNVGGTVADMESLSPIQESPESPYITPRGAYNSIRYSIDSSQDLIDEMVSSPTFTARHELESAKAEIQLLKHELNNISTMNDDTVNQYNWIVETQLNTIKTLQQAGNEVGHLAAAENHRFTQEINRLEAERERINKFNSLTDRVPKRWGDQLSSSSKKHKSLIKQADETAKIERWRRSTGVFSGVKIKKEPVFHMNKEQTAAMEKYNEEKRRGKQVIRN